MKKVGEIKMRIKWIDIEHLADEFNLSIPEVLTEAEMCESMTELRDNLSSLSVCKAYDKSVLFGIAGYSRY